MNEWQPIETAPRDGTAVLLYGGLWDGDASGIYDDGNDRVPLVCGYRGDVWAMCDTDFYQVRILEPTHWMPLPEPPQAPSEPPA